MPYAKIDVGFIRQHFAAVPEKTRPAAIALYLQLVTVSAEMLLDGRLVRTVVEASAAEIGLSRNRYVRRDSLSLALSLQSCGLVEIDENGTWTLPYWRDHHSSRGYVDDRRKADAERKRQAREQLTLSDTGTVVHSGRPPGVRSGHASDSRAHARTRAASETEVRPAAARSTEGPALPQPTDADAAAAATELNHLLDQLAIPDTLRARAHQEPGRALAVAHYTIHSNAGGGFFRTVFDSGDWPAANGAAPPTDPAERRERYVRGDGHLLPDDELEYQLRQMGADDDECIGLTELAADLRS